MLDRLYCNDSWILGLQVCHFIKVNVHSHACFETKAPIETRQLAHEYCRRVATGCKGRSRGGLGILSFFHVRLELHMPSLNDSHINENRSSSSSGVTCEIPHHENRDFASDLMLPRILAGTAIVRVLMLLPSACYSGIQR